MVDTYFGDSVPEEKENPAGRVDPFDVGFHTPLVSVVKDNDLLCVFDMFFPVAPEHGAEGDAQDIKNFVNQVSETPLRDSERRKNDLFHVREKVGLRFLENHNGIILLRHGFSPWG